MNKSCTILVLSFFRCYFYCFDTSRYDAACRHTKSPAAVSVRRFKVARPIPLLPVPQSVPKIGKNRVVAAVTSVRVDESGNELRRDEHANSSNEQSTITNKRFSLTMAGGQKLRREIYACVCADFVV